MNYLAKMRVLTLLLTLLGRETRSETMVHVEKLFSKNYGVGKILKIKEKLQPKCGILPQTNS